MDTCFGQEKHSGTHVGKHLTGLLCVCGKTLILVRMGLSLSEADV